MRVEADINGAKRGEPATFAVIDPDPGDHTVYVLDPQARTFRRSSHSLAVGTYDAGSSAALPVGINHYRIAHTSELLDPENHAAFEEAIEPRHIEGLAAVGRRLSVMVAGGHAGLEVTSERWESPDLKVLLAASVSDPRSRITLEHRLTKITRVAPAAALFAIPSDYAELFTSRDTPSFRWDRWDHGESEQRR